MHQSLKIKMYHRNMWGASNLFKNFKTLTATLKITEPLNLKARIQSQLPPHDRHHTSETETWNSSLLPRSLLSSHGDVFLPPTSSIPIDWGVLHLQGEVKQLEIHDERQIRECLPGLLSTPFCLSTTVRRDLQRLRPPCQALPEAPHQLDQALGSRSRCQGWAGSKKLCQGSYSHFFTPSILLQKLFEGATSRELSRAGLETKACVPTSKEGREQLDLFGRGRPLRRWIPDRIPRIPDHFGQRARGWLQGLRLHRPLLLEEKGDLLRDNLCRSQW